jgi:sugar phosphate isomerase/epimerase
MIIDRRAFLAGSGGLVALGALGTGSRALAAQVGAIGLQLYTVREIFAKDPVRTLEQVAKIGYREVEFGGGNYDSMDHKMLRQTMDRLHLKSPSIHVPYDMLLGKFDAAVQMAKTLGADTIIVPFLTPDLRTEAGFETVIPNINRFATQLKREGLGIAYHNHDFEFTNSSHGVPLYERLVKDTDPALVKFELDLYWAVHAGAKPAELIQRLSHRLYAFHVKDMLKSGKMTSVGAGTIDFGALFKLPGAAHVQHFYVENDEAPAPYLPDISLSYKNLRALRF